MRIRYRFLFISFLFIFFPIVADAISVQVTRCFSSGNSYSINYTGDGPFTETQIINYINSLTEQQVANGKLSYLDSNTLPDGVSATENFEVKSLAGKCYVSDGKINYCPSNSNNSYQKILNNYVDNDENVKFTFNGSTGKFTLKIKDVFDNELLIRYVSKDRIDNDNYDDADKFPGQFLTKVDGYYTVENLDPEYNVRLEFYENSNVSACNGYNIGYIYLRTDSSYDYEVDNPAIKNPEAYSCDKVKEYRPNAKMNEEEEKLFEEAKKSYISECYGPEKIKYGLISGLKENIENNFKSFKELFDAYNPISEGSKICTDEYKKGFNENGTPGQISYNYPNGTYWSMVCYEGYTASGDEPKLVPAGGGFEYQSTFSISRKCIITQKKENIPKLKSQCQYKAGHICSWVRNDGSQGEGGHSGPNTDFDQCILECDLGKYTQECINSCYSKVYDSNSQVFSALTTKKTPTLKFLGTVSGSNANYPNSPNGLITVGNYGDCTTPAGNEGTPLYYKGPHFNKPNGYTKEEYACYSGYCSTHLGQCNFWETSSPDGCIDNPYQTYNDQMEASKRELDSLIAKLNSSLDIGEYTYEITDSYLKTSDGKPYVFKVNSINDPALKIDTTSSSVAQPDMKFEIGSVVDGATLEKYSLKRYYVTIPNVIKRTDIVVSLPVSYINKVTSEVIYKTSTDSSKAFGIDFLRNNLKSVTDFNSEFYYYSKDNRLLRNYYTNIYSANKNVLLSNNKVELMPRTLADYNIKVSSSKVGDANFKSDIDCYYGVYNNFYCKDSNDCPSSDLDQTGIQWIFRPINLEDVFPNNRDPRWNWTGTLSSGISTGAASYSKDNVLQYNIDPIKLTQDIETKGNSIYDVNSNSSEIDYEFVLTRENLNNIRAYNKNVNDYNGDGEKNYGDYNMSCYKNSSGKEICKSKFLDNINGNSGSEESGNFITYSDIRTKAMRESIIGCNNAINGTDCDD